MCWVDTRCVLDPDNVWREVELESQRPGLTCRRTGASSYVGRLLVASGDYRPPCVPHLRHTHRWLWATLPGGPPTITPWRNNVILNVLSFLTFPTEQLYVLLLTGLSFKAIWLYFFKWLYSSLSSHSSVGRVCVVSWYVCHLQRFSSFTPNSFSPLDDFLGVLFKK